MKENIPVFYRLLYGNSKEKENLFLEGIGNETWTSDELLKLPNSILAYWISNVTYKHLINNKPESDFTSCTGLQTGDNKRFVRKYNLYILKLK